MLCLISAVQHSAQSCLYIFFFIFYSAFVTGFDYSSLCCTAGPCCQSVLCRIVYTCSSQTPSPSPSPTPTHKAVISVCKPSFLFFK